MVSSYKFLDSTGSAIFCSGEDLSEERSLEKARRAENYCN